MSDADKSKPLAAKPREVKPGEPLARYHDPSLPPIGEHRAPGSHVGLLDVEEEVDVVRLGKDDDTAGEVLSIKVFEKLLWVIASFAVLLGLSYAIPLPWAQPWRADEGYIPFWNVVGRELLGQGDDAQIEADKAAEMAKRAEQAADQELQGPVKDRKAITPPPETDEQLRYPKYVAHELDTEPEQALDNAEALAPFYDALTRTDIGYAGAVTRVGHWGDSVLGNDGITSAVRRRMQARFGDAGHGFHALKQYDASYRHQNVRFSETGSVRWNSCFIRNRCLADDDGRYGYGGVTVWSSGGAQSEFATVDKGPVGLEVSRFELWYQRRYQGGKIRVRIDGGADQVIDTAHPLPEGVDSLPPDQRPAPVDAWAVLEVPDGPHQFQVRAIGDGQARAYGVVLERDGPGVVWDGMALIGSFTSRLAEFDPQHLSAQLDHRDLDLMVFTFGGNDMTREKSDLRRTMDPYIQDYTRVIKLFRAARPKAACLIMGPVDHGERVNGRVASRDVAARMTQAQRQVALANGCAFFDTIEAMGGDGAIARWKSEGLMSGDLAHPSARGHKLLGAMVYDALIAGYVEFREKQAGQPMQLAPDEPEPEAPLGLKSAPSAEQPEAPGPGGETPPDPKPEPKPETSAEQLGE